MSRAARNAGFAEPITSEGSSVIDMQSHSLTNMHKAQDETVLLLARVLGDSVNNNALQEAARLHTQIVAHTSKAVDAMIAIGDDLTEMRQILGNKAFDRFIENSESWPYGRTHAYRAIAVANAVPHFKAVLGDDFNLNRLPGFSVCYQLSTLSEEERREAKELGLFDPLTTVKKIEEFKSAKKGVKAVQEGTVLDKLRALDKLIDEIRALERELNHKKALKAQLERERDGQTLQAAE